MRKTMAILASAAIALSLTACGSEPPVATCSEYAQLAPDTGLFTQMNDDQDAPLGAVGNDQRMMTKNVLAAHLKIIAYCTSTDAGGEDQNQQHLQIKTNLRE